MKNKRYVPGPWNLANADWKGQPQRLEIEGTEIVFGCEWRRRICKTYAIGDMDKELANAHLIAAAPELYEASDALLSAVAEFILESEARAISSENEYLTAIRKAGDKLALILRKVW